MIRLFLILLLAQLTLTAQISQWQWLHPKPAGNHINDIVVLTNGSVLFFTDAGGVGRSTDNGATWVTSTPDSLAGHRDIYEADFLNNNVGYAVGTAGLAMKTTDGGMTWNQLTTNLTSNLWYVDFVTENLGYIGGSSGKLLKTTDGGSTWAEQVIGGTTSVLVYKIHALNADTVYAGTGSATPGRLIRTFDGGATWSAVTGYTLTSVVRGIYFLNANIGFVADAGYAISKTTDGGTTWTPTDYGTGTFYEVKFATDSLGFAAGADGNIYVTTDQGTSWNPSFSGVAPSSNVYGLAVGGNLASNPRSNATVYAAGEGGFMARTTNSGATWSKLGLSLAREEMRKVIFLNDMFGYAVGGSATTADSLGVLFTTTDGGVTWNLNSVNPKYRIYSGYFPSANVGYVASRGGSGVWKTTDGGATWAQLTTPVSSTTNIWYDTRFANDNVGYLCDGSGNIVKTTDGGTTWTLLPDPHGTTAIYAIQLFSADDLIATGSSGKTYRSTDGGQTWTNLNPTTSTQYAIDFPSAQVGYLVGTSGGIRKTTDGGVTWTQQTSNSTSTLYSVRFLSENIGFVGGSVGAMLFTSDGGTTWTTLTNFVSNATIYDLAIRNGGIYATGSRGNIVKGVFSSSIPVELVSFSANVVDAAVVLEWSTATETNNDRFMIERKSGTEGWSAVGTVAGAGTSTEIRSYRFVDNTATSGVYTYRLKQLDYDGTFSYSQEVEVSLNAPVEFALYKNYPNPFNPQTTIGFALPVKSEVTLKIYDVLGNEVQTLLKGEMEAGMHNVEFRAANLASGVYIYTLQIAGGRTFSGKMNLLK